MKPKLFAIQPRGFCGGVIRAIETVNRALELWGAPIYVKHEIVHNAHVVSALKQKGAIFVEDIADIPRGSRVIYSAHGVSPQVRALSRERGLIEIDATCGLVTRLHSAAHRFAAKGYHILLIGHQKHVEVIGTSGEVPDATTVIESVADVDRLAFTQEDKLFYMTQTTLSLSDVKKITDRLYQRYPKIQTLPTSSICYATTNRQLALKQIASRVDLILVVGDPTSSNSNRLVEVAREEGVDSHLIHHPEQICVEWLDEVRAVAVTSGASTPERVTQACLSRLESLGTLPREEVVFQEENVTFELPKQVQLSKNSLA